MALTVFMAVYVTPRNCVLIVVVIALFSPPKIPPKIPRVVSVQGRTYRSARTVRPNGPLAKLGIQFLENDTALCYPTESSGVAGGGIWGVQTPHGKMPKKFFSEDEIVENTQS